MSDRTLTAHDYPPAVPAVGTGGASCADAGRLQSPQGGGNVAGKAAETSQLTNSTPSHPAESAAVGAQVVSGLDPVGAAAMPISGPRTSGVMPRSQTGVASSATGCESAIGASTSEDVTARRDGQQLPIRTGETTKDGVRGVDDPERGETVPRSGGAGRQPTASSAPGAAAPSGTAGFDSGGSAGQAPANREALLRDGGSPAGDATAAPDDAQQATLSTPEPAGSSSAHLCMGCNEDLPPGSIASRKWCDECIRKRRNKRKAERDREIRAQLGVSARQYKRTHAQPVERTTIGKGRCRVCAGLSERRPSKGVCGGCGLPWAPEHRPRIEDFMSGAIGALGRASETRARHGAARETAE